MSLLMEVLMEAEDARRQAEGKSADAPAFAATLSVEPLEEAPLTASIGSPLPDPSSDLSRPLDAVSSAPPMRRSPLAESNATERFSERNAARQAFAAKRRPETGDALWLIVGAGLLAILGVGGYFWWQLQAIQSPGVARPMAMPPASSTPPAKVMPVSTAPTVPVPVVSPPLVEESGTVRPAPETTPVASTGKSVMATRAPVAPLPPEQTQKNSAPASSESRQKQADATFRLTRASLQTNTVLEHAYEALQSGRDDEAQGDYEQVLRADGKNTDALLGLATLAARQGQVDKAHDYYLRALEADPGDSTARAGVLSTGNPGDNAESLLENALARQPDSPPLLFALGNLYARQRRWSEAQPAYFQAYTSEPDNPDIIFNLAVSLDHLRQNKLAAQYYRMALDAGNARTATFDRNQVEVRLLELQP